MTKYIKPPLASDCEWTPTVGVCDGGDSVENAKNAALIVAVVNAFPGLLDEVERLRADAARYRWLRDVGDYMMPPTPGVIRLDINDHIEHLSGDALDAAIDAAMGDDGSAT